MRKSLLLACLVAALPFQSAAQSRTDSAGQFQLLRSNGSADVVQKRVTLRLTDVRLEDALQEIARQAGFGLSYRPDLPELNRRVSLRTDSIRAVEAVLRVLEGTRIEALLGAGGRTLLLRPKSDASQQQCSLAGTVRSAEGERPIASADVRVIGSSERVFTGSEGTFCVRRIPVGTYSIEVGQLGYATARSDSVVVPSDHATALTFTLSPMAIPLSDVVVTPGHFGIAHESLNRTQTFSRKQIETLPQLGEDIYRTVNRLPGVASNELSAKLTVRGGDDESLLVLLDGLELYEPFHLKDFDGALSILDVAAIGGVDFTTGGFATEYGNRLTGVFDLRTTNQLYQKPRTSIGVSLSNARVMSQGSFANGNGLWLFSARRGYLDILLHLIGEGDNIDPRYYDGLGKVVYQLSNRQRVTVEALRAGDSGFMLDDDEVGTIRSNYGSTYGWLTLQSDFSDRLRVSTQVRTGALDWHRVAEDHGTGNSYDIFDTRDFSLWGGKQDWQLRLSDRWALKWGADFHHGAADYDYFNRVDRDLVVNGRLVTTHDSLKSLLASEGNSLSGYVSQRFRIWNPLTIETGLRYDRQSYTDQEEWLPRVNAALAIDPKTTIRAAWGRYAQPQALFQLRVQDGETVFNPAERAEQIVGGIEHTFARGVVARIEAYRRTESDLRPRYRNLENKVEPVAEVEPDRKRFDPESGRAEGVELLLQQHGPRASWSLSYALAHAYDLVAGMRTDRPLDQRHTFYLDYTYAPSPAWQLSWSWQYHSGWPITALRFSADTLADRTIRIKRTYSEPFGDRLPDYHRMDLRATRSIPLKHGRLAVFVDVFNLYNHDNPQSYNHSIRYQNGVLSVNRSIEPLLPRLPSVGATWEF